MNIKQVIDEIKMIEAYAVEGDIELAHSLEDTLRSDILREIRDHSTDVKSRRLASFALSSVLIQPPGTAPRRREKSSGHRKSTENRDESGNGDKVGIEFDKTNRE